MGVMTCEQILMLGSIKLEYTSYDEEQDCDTPEPPCQSHPRSEAGNDKEYRSDYITDD